MRERLTYVKRKMQSDKEIFQPVSCPVSGCAVLMMIALEETGGQYFIRPLTEDQREAQRQELLLDHFQGNH